MTYPLPDDPVPPPAPPGPRPNVLSVLYADIEQARAAFERLQSPARRVSAEELTGSPARIATTGGPVQHDPERPGGGSWPPGPPPHPRPASGRSA
jgi:hypothetical protein